MNLGLIFRCMDVVQDDEDAGRGAAKQAHKRRHVVLSDDDDE